MSLVGLLHEDVTVLSGLKFVAMYSFKDTPSNAAQNS